MRASEDFRILRATGHSALARLRLDVILASGSQPSRSANHALAVATIDLLNLWSNFSRFYALSCIMRPRRVSGGRVKVTMAGLDFNGVIGVAMKRYKPRATPRPDGSWHRRDEPPWHDTAVLTNVCTDLGCSHVADVQASVSLGSRVFDDLPVFRNFFAHRNRGTATAARLIAPHYAIPAYRHPLAILASTPAGRTNPLLVDWIDDLNVTIDLLCS
jgi:hypothetical protein